MVVLTLVGVGVLLVLGYWVAGVTNLIRFSPFTAAEFLQHLAPLVFVALIVERTLVVFREARRACGEAEVCVAHERVGRRILPFVVCVGAGAVLALMGVRALGMFVDPGEFQDLREWQRRAFHAVDVVLTTGFVAGASNGIHEVTSLLGALVGRAKRKLERPV